MSFSFCQQTEVCFFDSGIGGLNLLYECVRRLPRVKFTYFADNFNVPYGNLSREQILQKADGVFSEIDKRNPAAAVIACNTVTASCAEYLRSKYDFPIVGIQPAIKPAAAHGGKCLVLATPTTVCSDSVKSLIEHFGNGTTEAVACPDLASYIENNIFALNREKIFSLLPKNAADSVVLGCTHYGFIKKEIREFYGCPVYDGVEGTAKRLCEILGNISHLAAESEKNVKFIGGDAEKNSRVFDILSEN